MLWFWNTDRFSSCCVSYCKNILLKHILLYQHSLGSGSVLCCRIVRFLRQFFMNTVWPLSGSGKYIPPIVWAECESVPYLRPNITLIWGGGRMDSLLDLYHPIPPHPFPPSHSRIPSASLSANLLPVCALTSKCPYSLSLGLSHLFVSSLFPCTTSLPFVCAPDL